MSLTSGALLVLLGAGVAITLAATVVVRRRILRVATGLVLVATSALWFGAAENDQFSYYTSWAALFGQQRPPDLVGPTLTLGSPPGATSTPSAPPIASLHPAAGAGALTRVTFAGARSGITRTGYVYLPPQYFQPQYATTRFPVLELLNGSPGAPLNWLQQVDVVKTMDQLLAKHRVEPMVLVIPATNSHLTTSLECVNAVHGAQDDTYLTTDVRQDVLSTLRVDTSRSGWGLAGYSTGGFCAINLLLRHPQWYSAAASMDGYFQAIQDSYTGNLYHGDALARQQNSPAWTWLHGTTGLPVDVYLQAGTHDPEAFVDAVRFHDEMVSEGPRVGRRFTTAFTVQTGSGHSFAAWRAGMPMVLGWAADHLSSQTLKHDFPVIPPAVSDVPQARLDALALALLGAPAPKAAPPTSATTTPAGPSPTTRPPRRR